MALRVWSRRDPLLRATGDCYEFIGFGIPANDGVVWGLEREIPHHRSLEPPLSTGAFCRVEVGSGFHISEATCVSSPRTTQR